MMKLTLTLLALYISVHLFGQTTITQTSADNNTINEFKTFFEQICDSKSDTLLDQKDSLIKYKVVFTSQGNFSDTKNHLFRLSNVKNIKKTDFFADVFLLKNKPDSLANYYMSRSCKGIKTCVINESWGNALADSLIGIQSDPSFWASCASAKEVRFSQNISVREEFGKEQKKRSLSYPYIISYQNGKFLIIDIMTVISVGNQTDGGLITTCYLKRIK